MAAGYAFPKQLGGANPGTTETTLFTVNANSRGVLGLLVTVSNTAAAARTFRIYVTPNVGTKRYIAYNEPLAANASRSFALPGLATSDVVGVYGSAADVDFAAFGIEIS